MHRIDFRFILVWTVRIVGYLIAASMLTGSIAWFITDHGFEPMLGLFASLSTFFTTAVSSSFVERGLNEEEFEERKLKRKREEDARLALRIEKQRMAYLDKLRRKLIQEEKLFVPLPTESRIRSKFEAYAEYLQHRERDADLMDSFESIEEAMEHYPRFVLLGDPGSGKSTTLRHIAFTLIDRVKANASADVFASRFKLNEDGEIPDLEGVLDSMNRERWSAVPMPFLIRLGYSSNPPDAEMLIQHWWNQEEKIEGDVRSFISRGELWLLFDGLNEMPDARSGAGMIEERAASLRKFLQGYSGPAIVTCRIADYSKALELNLPIIRIKRLSPKEITSFAHKRLKHREQEFLNELNKEVGRKALATNPYALTMMIELFLDPKFNLPNTREALFNTYIKKRFNDNQTEMYGNSRVSGNLEELKRLWAKLAYRMMIEGFGTTVKEGWAKNKAIGAFKGTWSVNAALSLGLMVRDEDETRSLVSFYHQLIYEFLLLTAYETIRDSPTDVAKLINRLVSVTGNLRFEMVLPILTSVFVKDSEIEDVRVYCTACRVLNQVCQEMPDPVLRELSGKALLHTTLRILEMYQFQFPRRGTSAARLNLLRRTLYKDLRPDILNKKTFETLIRDLERSAEPDRDIPTYTRVAIEISQALGLSQPSFQDKLSILRQRQQLCTDLLSLAEEIRQIDFYSRLY